MRVIGRRRRRDEEMDMTPNTMMFIGKCKACGEILTKDNVSARGPEDGHVIPGSTPELCGPIEFISANPTARLEALEEVAKAAADHMALFDGPLSSCNCTICVLQRKLKTLDALAKLEDI